MSRDGATTRSAKPTERSLEQRAVEQLRAVAAPWRLRIQRDFEGFPFIPGRYGQIEWFDGRDLAVFTMRPRLFKNLWAIPGVRRHQTGDSEMRAVFPPEALKQVAAVIRARRKRPQTSPRSLQNLRSRATSRSGEGGSEARKGCGLGAGFTSRRTGRK
jgi:hypothetical protein